MRVLSLPQGRGKKKRKKSQGFTKKPLAVGISIISMAKMLEMEPCHGQGSSLSAPGRLSPRRERGDPCRCLSCQGMGEHEAAQLWVQRDGSPFARTARGARRWVACRRPGKQPLVFELGFHPCQERDRLTNGRAVSAGRD